MKNLTFFLIRLPSYFLWLVSFFFLRSKTKWCFGSQSGFSGSNSKYLYYEIVMKHPEIKAAWICKTKDATFNTLREKGFPVYYKWSLEGLWFCLTSKVYCYTHGVGDVNFATSGGTYKLNLWHGVGIKKSEYLAQLSWVNFSNPIHRIIFPFYCTHHDMLIVTSESMRKLFSDCFRIPYDSDRLVYTYTPRLMTHRLNGQDLNKMIDIADSNLHQYIKEIKMHNRTFFYMPTYRQDEKNNVLESSCIDFPKLNDILKSRNDFMLIKLHPRDLAKINKSYNYSNILIIKDLIDIYLLFPYIDVVITDYSSVYADFLLYKGEAIIFDFDIDNYMKKEQGLYYDFHEYTSAIFAHNAEELLELIQNRDHYPVPEKERMIKLYWGRVNDTPDLVAEIGSRISLA